MFAGVAYGAWKTRGFQADLVNFDVPSELGFRGGDSA